MNKFKHFITPLLFVGLAVTFQSCLDDDDDKAMYHPTALVTVEPADDESFIMHLDDNTILQPVNMAKSPYGKKEVRALVNFSETVAPENGGSFRKVYVNWLGSIRTKRPVPTTDINDSKFGNDPVEIMRDWVTVAEDGYLTLRVRTRWNNPSAVHELNLLTGVNPENPHEFELRHNAHGDTNGEWGDGLIAFNLNGLPELNGTISIKLRWKSFSGEKTSEFSLRMRDGKQPQLLVEQLSDINIK